MCEEGSEENRFGTAMAGQRGTWDGARTCLLGKEGRFGAPTGLGLVVALCVIMVSSILQLGVGTKS